MSGHSKWANIKHRKASQDAKRGQIFTRLGKELSVAAKHGGSDFESNFKLRTLIDKAREANMPADNIDRAIKRGTGELPGISYEEQLYEGYGPEGIAVLVECLTDNKNRTVSEMRRMFSSNAGNLAEAGAVIWMFDKKGVIRITASTISEDSLLEELLDCEIDDISVDENNATIIMQPKQLELVKKTIIEKKYTIESFDVEWVAKNLVELAPEKEKKVIDFLERIEELDDTQNVYSNLA